MKQLGKVQAMVLTTLKERGEWSEHGDWVWGNRSNTKRVLDSLVKLGVVRKQNNVYIAKLDHIRGDRIFYCMQCHDRLCKKCKWGSFAQHLQRSYGPCEECQVVKICVECYDATDTIRTNSVRA